MIIFCVVWDYSNSKQKPKTIQIGNLTAKSKVPPNLIGDLNNSATKQKKLRLLIKLLPEAWRSPLLSLLHEGEGGLRKIVWGY